MEKCTTAPGSGALESECAGCGAAVQISLSRRTVQVHGGTSGGLTYADPDIAVWDCPACAFPNADVLGE